MPCSLARSLEAVGEWWTLLIIRDCFLGITRFDHFQTRLGIARNVLSDRLDTLVDHQVVERHAYQEHPPRYDYLLTDKGRALWPVLTALQEWGDQWGGWEDLAAVERVHTPCGHPTQLVPTCASCRGVLHGDDVTTRLAPGSTGRALPDLT